ncbi:MAG: 5'-3' exonuclease H3TH domain-containing protein [Wenzhouxiangellaceae bacterium]
MSVNATSQTLYLVDASIYIFRAWYSVPPEFSNAAGEPTNAVYGFAGFLCDLLETQQPAHIAIAFDEALESSYRNDIYPAYKANREPAPEQLLRQFAWCRQIAELLGIPCYSDKRFEADDLIASMALQGRASDLRINVISADKDLTQIIREHDHWWDFARNVRLDRAAVKQKFGVFPEQIADYLALAGDAVDNIPGIPGIGPKTAAALLAHFTTLEALLERMDEVAWLSLRGAKGIHGKLTRHADAARLARQLTGCHEQALPGQVNLQRSRGDGGGMERFFDELGFGRMLRARCQALV